MKATIKTTKEIDVRYMKVDAGVRYWEDSKVNGKKDIDPYESEGVSVPAMPFAVKVKDKPDDRIYRWQPVIDVEKGCIVDWPKGTTANVHYKVCDDGTYTLLDADKKVLLEVDSYVPDCIGEYGDYIIMDIDENGHIGGFDFTADDVEQIAESGF